MAKLYRCRNAAKTISTSPPLLFWFSALAFRLFGVSNFSYRIFPILFSWLGAYATFRLGCLYYNRAVGRLAALMLLSCQAFFLMNHDVRTDTMLTASVILAIWLIAEFTDKGHWYGLVLGFGAIGLAMLAKGQSDSWCRCWLLAAILR
ncbi:MAG: glycosyltransferase family 39 protein [Bacteroidia bacterium]|nr:glycosyltransferase family 39 protein [Bacteroidia bacterium]